MLFRHQDGAKQINLYAENIRCLDCVKKVDSKAINDSALSRTSKVFNVRFGRYSRWKFKFNLCLKIKSNSWTKNFERVVTSLSEKPVPIQEEEKASGKPAAKARPILKPSSTSGWDSIPMEQRQWIDINEQESQNVVPMAQRKWIDIEVQRYKDPSLFSSVKIHDSITLTVKEVNREEDAGVPLRPSY